MVMLVLCLCMFPVLYWCSLCNQQEQKMKPRVKDKGKHK